MTTTQPFKPRSTAKGTPVQPGSWVAVPKSSAPDDVIVTALEPLEALRAHVKTISDESGYNGIMPAFFGVVIDREEVSSATITGLTYENMNLLYDSHVGQAVDEVNTWMIEYDRGIEANRDEDAEEEELGEPASPGDPEIVAHIASISEEAGFGSIMPAFFDIILDREEVTAETFLDLTSGDMEMLYYDFVGRAVDRVTRQLSADDAADNSVQAFIRDERSNHSTMFDPDENPLTWQEAVDSLDQMPDHILTDVTGDADTDTVRERLRAIARYEGFDSQVDI